MLASSTRNLSELYCRDENSMMRAGQLVPLLHVDGQLELCPMENLLIVRRVEHEDDDLFVEDLILSGSVSSVILLACSSCGWRCCCPIHGVTPNRDTFGGAEKL